MPNECLSRLVVSGPMSELQRFVRDAAPPSATPGGRVPPDALSLQRLKPLKSATIVRMYGTKWLEPGG
jgi:hypothetical protein